MNHTNWRDYAACHGDNPEKWFPVADENRDRGESASARQQADAAKAVCNRCPVRPNCLEWALETGQDYGVWGGMSPNERRAFKRSLTRAS